MSRSSRCPGQQRRCDARDSGSARGVVPTGRPASARSEKPITVATAAPYAPIARDEHRIEHQHHQRPRSTWHTWSSGSARSRRMRTGRLPIHASAMYASRMIGTSMAARVEGLGGHDHDDRPDEDGDAHRHGDEQQVEVEEPRSIPPVALRLRQAGPAGAGAGSRHSGRAWRPAADSRKPNW